MIFKTQECSEAIYGMNNAFVYECARLIIFSKHSDMYSIDSRKLIIHKILISKFSNF